MLSDKFECVDPITEGLARVTIDNKYGAVDKAGNLIVDVRFDALHFFSDGLAYARIGNTHGYINTSGTFEIQKPVAKPTLLDRIKGKANQMRW